MIAPLLIANVAYQLRLEEAIVSDESFCCSQTGASPFSYEDILVLASSGNPSTVLGHGIATSGFG